MNWWVLKKRLHASWLIAIGSFAFSCGVFFAKQFSLSFDTLPALFVLSTILLVTAFLHRYVYLLPVLVIGSLLLGWIRGGLLVGDTAIYKQFTNKPVDIVGIVTKDVDIKNESKQSISLGRLVIDGQEVAGMVWVDVASDGLHIQRGDQVAITGVMKEGFGSYSGLINDANLNRIYSNYDNDWALRLRDWFTVELDRYVGKPESDLGAGFAVGQKQALDGGLSEAVMTVGLTHVVVASGYNLTILVRLARRLFSRFSKYLSVMSSFLMIFAFMSITGLSPSMMRAGLVAGLCLLAWYYGRNFHPLVLLSVVMAITLAIDPSYVWGDLGWQLSFAAFFGVMIVAPLLQRYLFGDKKSGTIQQIAVEAVSAQIVTAPIVIAVFGKVSMVAVVANLLVLPLVPLAMLLSFVTIMISLVFGWLASLVGLITKYLIAYMIFVVEELASLPWVSVSLSLDWWGVALCFMAIIAGCFYMWRKTGYALRSSNLVE